jgi:predicted dehydrogenase
MVSPSGPRFRTAIVGTGAIAHAHAAAVAALPERASVVAAVDVDPDRARTFAEQFGIPATYPSVEALLAAETLDLVHVCTPPKTHVPIARAAMQAGVVPLIEKPPALTLLEMDALAETSALTGVPALTVFQHRFGSAAVKLRRLLHDGTLGRPLVATCETLWFRDDAYFDVPWRGTWEVEGGGPTLGHGIHQFDLLLSVLGDWDEVTAIAARQSRPTNTEDVSLALVRFGSGAVASVVNSIVSPRETSRLRFDFEHATVEVEHLYGYRDANWTVTPAPGHEAVLEAWNDGAADVESGHTAQLAAIFDALQARERPPVGLDESRRTMELTAAIYASAFRGRSVRSGEIGADDPFAARMDGGAVTWPPVKEPVA